MVASEEEEILWELDFVAEKQAHGLDGLLAAIDVVPKEQVVRLGRKPSVFEDPEQVVILAVYIA